MNQYLTSRIRIIADLEDVTKRGKRQVQEVVEKQKIKKSLSSIIKEKVLPVLKDIVRNSDELSSSWLSNLVQRVDGVLRFEIADNSDHQD